MSDWWRLPALVSGARFVWLAAPQAASNVGYVAKVSVGVHREWNAILFPQRRPAVRPELARESNRGQASHSWRGGAKDERNAIAAFARRSSSTWTSTSAR